MTRATDPLVSTKLRPSQARPQLVARPRLVECLAREPGRRLTLISAPAGFGKTTLLSKWSNTNADDHRSVAWVSLDGGDNDPARFLSYLVAAIGRVVEDEGFGEGILAALRSPQPPRLEALVESLANEFADLPGEVSLVLDDYHSIDSEAVHGIVSSLLERMPPNVHLVISSRVDPPLPVSRLRARGQMAELGAAELAFTEDEAGAFLRSVMGLELSNEDITILKERTEGWIAGLQLAGLSMRGREDPSGFIEAFSGGHRDVLDFLAEEVLERQPDDVREFLLKTSILDGLTGPLCDALTGRSDGDEMLERLERENLFVVALDDERRWYRYHHLFAEFLRGRLTRKSPERVSKLHLRASGWYEGDGMVPEAIGHALSASDHALAARLIEGEGTQAFGRGEVPTVLRWLEALPTEAKRRRPRLLLQHALALALTGRSNDVEPLLEEAERAASQATDEKDRRFLFGFASAVRSWCARLRGDAPRAVELARRALSLLPDEAGSLRAFAAVSLGDTLWTTGDLTSADEALSEATRIGRAAGHVYSTLSAMTLRARVQIELGRLRDADETLGRAHRYAAEQKVELLPAAGAIRVVMGALLYERDDLDGAERELEAGLELAELTGNVTDLVWGYVTLSRARRARLDEGGALEMAQKADRVAREYGANLEIAIAHAWMARLRAVRGEVAEASAFEREHAANAGDAAGAAWMVDRIASARLLYLKGRHEEAISLLDAPQEAAQTAGRTGGAVEILVLRALALWATNRKELAVNALTEALALAAPEDHVRTFVDEGPPVDELLSQALEAQQRGRLDPPVPPHYLRKLLAATEKEATGAASQATTGLTEQLSERELEVLALVAAGKSNRRVATELFVGVGTVKTHLYNAYRKLGAHSRTQAVAKARELNLI